MLRVLIKTYSNQRLILTSSYVLNLDIFEKNIRSYDSRKSLFVKCIIHV